MHKQMYALIPNGTNSHIMEIFGYSTKGVPGLEIVGLGNRGKSIKEKFVYLNKKLGLKLPPRRFVLCVEDSMISSCKDDLYRWLELPFLIMYWSMAMVLPIQNLDNCLCGGMITARGKINMGQLSSLSLDELEAHLETGLKLITSDFSHFGPDKVIPLREIIGRDDLILPSSA
ncbi:hypothetical protein [Bacteriovorax sp. DB6_IX]|uniref:hypothetical protein n=1 Tax=Bacteriovorax sp. DB6_IX TaxID=1353530 RepID=UPI00038A2593|nr:hypothetical protein [Bacteriovorax sp. DB6_IX]EQC52240.1 hypothetical protein M901_1136 [Bacteriovorax sp. DB6_IX]